MTLLNGLLALGALAFTVPLAIHLLFRSRFRTIDWGAMHLLDNVIRINRRRLQLMHLLLLLLRCLLPILLAFCLARPVLTGFRSLPGDAPQTLVLVMDDSRSMAARDETGVSRMDRAKQELRELLSNLSRRDEVILIRSSDVDAPPATMGAQDALQKLREVTAETGPIDLGQLVRAGVEAAEEASHQQRRVVLISDFQSQNVSDATLQTLARLSTSLADKSVRPVISFMNLGVDSDQLSNVSVESIEVDSPAVVAGRNARFSATLRNASDTPMRDLRVVWSIDGVELEPRTISISQRSTATSRLTRRLDDARVHEVTVAIEHGDALVEDNRRSIGVDVIREVNVMLVDGQPSSKPLEGETDFLAIALSPFAFGGQDQPDAVRTSAVSESRIAKELVDQQPDILVMANVKQPRDDARRAIAQFVLDGGSLIVFDGERLNAEAYNQAWTGDSESWKLPANLGAFVGTKVSKDAEALPIGMSNAAYSPWDVLGDADLQPFGKVEVYGYRKLTLQQPESDSSTQPDSAKPPTAITLLSMGNGDPLILKAARGRGQVVQFGLPCDAAWTTLPMRMVYLPMMQQLVLDLAGSRKRTTSSVGRGFSVPANEVIAATDPNAIEPRQSPSFTLEKPGQPEVAIELATETGQLMVTDASRPGVYRIRQRTPMKEETPIVTSTIRIVDVPPTESRLRDVEPSRLAAAASSIDANVYQDLQSLQSDDQTRRYGREIWRWLLVLLLIAMVAELFVQQRSVRVTPNLGTT
ncbi:MAG: VWA domain-containing protein [Rubripirellula sp.]